MTKTAPARGPARSILTPTRAVGSIVSSDSHILYWCQVYGPHEIAEPPRPQDHPFGQFVRVELPAGQRDARPGEPRILIAVVCDTVLVNPAFGSLGPRLSTSDEQRAVFSPDYLTERATLLRLLALGTVDAAGQRIAHGVPPLALELGAVVAPVDADGVRTFHYFADDGPPGGATPYLHMGYLPQLIAEPGGLMPQAALCILDQLHVLFPEHERLIAILRRNLAWKRSVESAG